MNLFEFLDEGLKPTVHWRYRRAHIKEPGFSTLYVRISQRYIFDVHYRPVLDIASVEATVKGKGKFTALLRRIREKHPDLPIYVESVIMDRFQNKLKRLGFLDVGPELCPSLFLPPRKDIGSA